MREIKFRGLTKGVKNDYIWVYGFLATFHTILVIKENFGPSYEIKRKSVGEYTGIKDYEGKEIYEGDIVEKEIMESIFDDSKLIGVVKMIEGCWCVVNDKKKVAKNLWSETDVNRVIGNVYENPELLEED